MSRACDVVILPPSVVAWPSGGRPGDVLVGRGGAIAGAVALVNDAGTAVEVTAGATLPTTPAAALLDAGAPSTFVALNALGVGETLNASAARTRLGLPGLASLTVLEATLNGFLGTNGTGQGVALSPAAALTRLGLPGLPSVTIADVASPESFVVTDALGAGDTATPAEARALLAETVTYDFATSAGVTLDNGTVGGTAAVTGGVLQLTCPDTPAARYFGTDLEAPYGDVSVPRDDRGFRPLAWRAWVRLAGLGAGSTARWLAVSTGGARVGFFVGTDGSLGAEDNVTAVAYATAGAGSVPVDGTGWLAIEVQGDVAAYSYGAGTLLAPPSSWTTLVVATLPAVAAWTTLRLVGSTNVAPGAVTAVEYDDLTIEVL